MAVNIPPQLKPAGIAPFVIRAVQLESAKPVIAYWCYYWVVQQILKKQLHNADEECLQFTTTIMDKLEQMKTDQADNDAILDDVAGQAYVEQFAQETFDRALRPLRANKVTQQTASTFEAAATFFQLVHVWGQPEPETLEKIKYAKWNAARILKAIKEGKDPNESNPKQEEPRAEEGVSPLDPNDPEVQLINSAQPRPATVEEVPDDEGMPHPPASGYSLNPNPAALVSAPTSPLPPTAPLPEPVSPIAPPDVPAQEPGSYFADANPPIDQSPLDLPSTTSMPPPGAVSHGAFGPPPGIPSPSSHHPSIPPSGQYASPGAPSSPQDFYHAPPQHQTAPARSFIPPQQHYVPSPAPSAPHNHHNPYSQPAVPKAVPALQPPPQHYGSSSGPTGPYQYDDMAVAQAQKHAKWAISALNFEDVPTAVRELQAALATLGAR
ncbi:Vta1 like-domain-containing protein [Nemania serpens]|nr:Vta1 like-domain-containing protein [Nemania serpens]